MIGHLHPTCRKKIDRLLSLTRLDYFTRTERLLLVGLLVALIWGGLGTAWRNARKKPGPAGFSPDLYRELLASLPGEDHRSDAGVDFAPVRAPENPPEIIYLTRPPSAPPPEKTSHFRPRLGRAGKINLNTASRRELETLPGIGPAIAARIIQYRKKHGGFGSLKDLEKVKGIGEKRLEQIKDKITLY
jgi:competence ComEA-like helix-hairpin-helix protein